jgi:hypothetical protein
MRTVIESRPGCACQPWRKRSNTGRRKATRPVPDGVVPARAMATARARWTAPSSSSCPWAKAVNRSSGSRPACACCRWRRAAAFWSAPERHAQGGLGPRAGAPGAALQSNRLNDAHTTAHSVMVGKLCSECGAHAVIRKDGCDYCTNCGHLGSAVDAKSCVVQALPHQGCNP